MTKRMTALYLAILLALSACKENSARAGESGNETETSVTESQPSATEPQTTETEPPITETEPPITETEPPITETEPQTTETEPPITETEPPITETEPQTTETEPQTTPPETTTVPPSDERGGNKALSLTVTENDSGYYDTKYLLTNHGGETVSEIRSLLPSFEEFAEIDGMRINYPNGNVEMIDWDGGVPDLENSEKYFNALSAMDYDENCDLLAPGESMEIYTHTEGKQP